MLDEPWISNHKLTFMQLSSAVYSVHQHEPWISNHKLTFMQLSSAVYLVHQHRPHVHQLNIGLVKG